MTDTKAIRAAKEPANYQAVSQSLIINALTLDARIGVYESEKLKAQPIVIWLEAELNEPSTSPTDSYEDVVCYDTIVQQITQIVSGGHINLVETLIAMIADRLFQISQIKNLKIRVEKPSAILSAEGVGIEYFYERSKLSH